MSEYRNPNDPMLRDSPYDFNARAGNAASGWVAGGVLLVIVIGLALGIGHMPNQANHNTAINGASPPPMTQPSGPASRTYSPMPMNRERNPAPASAQP